eukprot:4554458-Pleurochrysis_carterae.AAC.1
MRVTADRPAPRVGWWAAEAAAVLARPATSRAWMGGVIGGLQLVLSLASPRRVSAKFAFAGAVRGYAAATGELRKTPLHPVHVSLGAKMAAFGGWDMPIQYPDGIMKSHLHTRCALCTTHLPQRV